DVLVVDDDKAINQVLCRFLQGSGFRVRPALDGQSALEQVRASLPRAILLDLMLPYITGFEVCEELKRDPQTQSIRGIMITALAGQSALEQVRASLPWAILLDLILTDITGFEVCEDLKRDPQTQSIPLIMITALADDDSIERGKACGAMAYLTKPFDLDKLVA